jgi:hypothetical protein
LLLSSQNGQIDRKTAKNAGELSDSIYISWRFIVLFCCFNTIDEGCSLQLFTALRPSLVLPSFLSDMKIQVASTS